MSKAFALLLLSTAACSAAEAGGGSPVTPYSCEGIVASAQSPQIDPEILSPWHTLATAEVANLPWALRAQRLATAKLPALTVHGKILLQHQMLLVAQRLDHLRRTSPLFQPAHQAVMDRILAIAPPKEDFAALDGSHPYVHAVLGPASGIVERATSTCGSGNSVHAEVNRGLLAFRPIRTETTRALVAQIVAFDNEGLPHVTPIVEGMELRRGQSAEAPACVIQTRDDGTLHAVAYANIVEHKPFVRKTGNGNMSCNSCHRTADDVGARDLRATEVADVDQKRDGQVERLATRLWNSFEGDLTWGTTAVRSVP